MEAINIKAYTNNNTQINAIKAILKAMEIRFEVGKEKSYNKKFVEKILAADEDIKAGKGIKMSIAEFKALCK